MILGFKRNNLHSGYRTQKLQDEVSSGRCWIDVDTSTEDLRIGCTIEKGQVKWIEQQSLCGSSQGTWLVVQLFARLPPCYHMTKRTATLSKCLATSNQRAESNV